MNAKLVNSVADAICRAMKNGKRTPAGIALALESAQLIQSPETAAELAEVRRHLESERVDGRRLIRSEQRTAELEAVLGSHRKDDQAEIERLRSWVAALASERHSMNEALDDAAKQMRADRDRIAELEGTVRLLNTQRGDVGLLVERERGYGEECVDIDDVVAALVLGSDEVPVAGES